MIEEIIKYIDELMSVNDDRLLELVKRKIQQLKQQNNDTNKSVNKTNNSIFGETISKG